MGVRGASALASASGSESLVLGLSGARNFTKLASNPALWVNASLRSVHLIPASVSQTDASNLGGAFNTFLDFLLGTAHAQSSPTMRRINPRPGGLNGPTITFNNDVTGGPSTDLPVREELAELIEDVAVSTGFDINVNSTTGHPTSSRHQQGRAADVNRINGVRADNPANVTNVTILQDAMIVHGNANQVLGPVRNVNIWNGATTPITNKKLINDHRDHIHINVPR